MDRPGRLLPNTWRARSKSRPQSCHGHKLGESALFPTSTAASTKAPGNSFTTIRARQPGEPMGAGAAAHGSVAARRRPRTASARGWCDSGPGCGTEARRSGGIAKSPPRRAYRPLALVPNRCLCSGRMAGNGRGSRGRPAFLTRPKTSASGTGQRLSRSGPLTPPPKPPTLAHCRGNLPACHDPAKQPPLHN